MNKHQVDMKTFYFLTVLAFFAGVSYQAKAQDFVNGDLNGEVTAISDLPNNWESVPYDDPACYADEDFEATPDITNNVGFTLVEGIKGKPYSGDTFLAGLDFGPEEHHEGIQQKVDGLKPGQSYTITFYQCVVKQENAPDTSGAWTVYADKNKLGVTEASVGHHHWNSSDVTWEKRTITFEAKKRSHLFKFMPTDDDSDYNHDDEGGALRMGIDMISILPADEVVEKDTVETIVEKDTTETIVNDELPVDPYAAIVDTSRLEVATLDFAKWDTVEYREPVEILLQRPGKLTFDIVPGQIDMSLYPNPTAGAFFIKTSEEVFELTVTDIAGHIIIQEEKWTSTQQVEMSRQGHFIVIIRADGNQAVKKLVVL